MNAACQPAAEHPLRLGFAGLGWIGRKRLDAIARHDGITIAAVCDAQAKAVDSVAGAFPGAFATDSFADLLKRDLDAVVIATPNALHAPQSLRAFERGLAVFCQKPLALSAHDTEAVLNAARRADRCLGVDYCYRHVAGMRALRERVRNGELGKLLFVEMKFHNAYGPDKRWCYDKALSGGGCLLDLGVHLIDLAVWLLDLSDLSVLSANLFSSGKRAAPDEVEDVALAQLTDQHGAALRLACSWNLHAGRDCEIELAIYGTRAGAVWRNVNGSFYDFVLEWTQGTRREMLGEPPDDWGDRALHDWVNALHANRRFDAAALAYRSTARIIDSIYSRTSML